jgi:transcriptional regulator with XRE-family HTH domain
MTQTFSPPEVSPKEMGKHLREVRRKKGLSLSEVARGAGLSRRELVAYERGKTPIPESDLWVLAGSCGVDVAELRPIAAPRAIEAGPESITDSITQLRRTHDGAEAPSSSATAIEAPPEPIADVPTGLLQMPETESALGGVDIFEELASLPEPAPLPARGDPPPDFLAPPSDLEDLAFPVSSAEIIEERVAADSDTPPNDGYVARADMPTVDLVNVLATRGSSTISATDAPPLDVPLRSESVVLPPKEPTPAPDFSDPGFATPSEDADAGDPFDDPTGPVDDFEGFDADDVDPTPPVFAPLPAPDLEEMIDPEPLPGPWDESPWAMSDAFDCFTTSDLLTDPPASNGNRDHGSDSTIEHEPRPIDDTNAWSARTPDPAATDSGFFIDWGAQDGDAEGGPNFEPGAGELPSRAPGASDWLRELTETASGPLTPAEALAEELRSFDAAFGSVTLEPTEAEAAANGDPAADNEPAPADRPPVDDTLSDEPAGDHPLMADPFVSDTFADDPGPLDVDEVVAPESMEVADLEPEPEPGDAPSDDDPAPISWHPELDALLVEIESEPTPAPSVAVDEVFVTAGTEWELGNALPLVEVRAQGALVMRRADERWALADLRCSDDFAVEVVLEFRSGPGFGVLFRADVADGRMSGYSFDLDPIYDGGSFLVRQWLGDRELWNPIAHVAAPDPAALYGHLTVRLEVAGARVVALVNGVPVLSVEDLGEASAERGRDAATGDRVGVQAWSSSDLVIETLRVADHTR